MTTEEEIAEFLPLREPTFLILLSLAESDKHGYAILQDVTEISQGKVKMSTGTLYEALARLLDQGLIERVPETTETHPGKPRKAYRLTLKGQQVGAAETARLQTLTLAAQQRLGPNLSG
ncbi:MAG: PadR family transcriptional regulator [Anaerolineaceae bacterium]|nr:PadR family transcriptional regulator [Anaerolineaceae bacterium]